MPNEPTNKDLMNFMGKMAEDIMVIKEDITVIKEDVAVIKGDIQRVENKVDRALFQEIDRHERWIKQIADKVGIKLER